MKIIDNMINYSYLYKIKVTYYLRYELLLY